jgi:hypothetical protein
VPDCVVELAQVGLASVYPVGVVLIAVHLRLVRQHKGTLKGVVCHLGG